jgi:hypothetical protein
MARSPYGGNKRRREIAKKKKREAKLARKHSKGDETETSDDSSYLEYLYPGGVPEELLPDSEDEAEDEDSPEDED